MPGCRKISQLLNSYFVSVFSEEEGGDLLKSSFSFPGTPEEELGTDTSLRSPVLPVRGRGRGAAPGTAEPRHRARGTARCHRLRPKNPQSNPPGHSSPAP